MIIPMSQNQEKALVGSTAVRSASTSIKMTGKVFQIISAGLYKDRILAILRELSTNAWDSHIAAGETRDFEVSLPTPLKPEFRIRDFGTGMSEETVFQVFNCLFESTKTESNDYNGMLGLGSKSPFSYTKMMAVASYQNGVVKWYNMFVDETGLPSLTKLGEAETTEPNGLEISFNVNTTDFEAFKTAAVTVRKSFVRGPKPKFNLPLTHAEMEEFVPGVFVSKKEDSWAQYDYYSQRCFYAIQGNVAYPIPGKQTQAFWSLGIDKAHDVYIEFPIGTLEFATSREELAVTPANSEVLKERMQGAAEAVSRKLEKLLDDIPTDIPSLMLEYDKCFYKTALLDRVAKKSPIAASILRNGFYRFCSSKELYALITTRYSDRNVVYKHSHNCILTFQNMRKRYEDTVIVLIDEKKFWRARTEKALKDGALPVFVDFSKESEQNQEAYLKELAPLLEVFSVLKVSELPRYTPVARGKSSRRRARPYTWFKEIDKNGVYKGGDESLLEDLLDYPEQEAVLVLSQYPSNEVGGHSARTEAAHKIGAIRDDQKVLLVTLSRGRTLQPWSEEVVQEKFGKNVRLLDTLLEEKVKEITSSPSFADTVNTSRKVLGCYRNAIWFRNLAEAVELVAEGGERDLEDYFFLKEFVDIEDGLCDNNPIDELGDVLPGLAPHMWLTGASIRELATKLQEKSPIIYDRSMASYKGDLLRLLEKREGEQ